MIDYLLAISILSGLFSPDVDPLVDVFNQFDQLKEAGTGIQTRLNEIVYSL